MTIHVAECLPFFIGPSKCNHLGLDHRCICFPIEHQEVTVRGVVNASNLDVFVRDHLSDAPAQIWA